MGARLSRFVGKRVAARGHASRVPLGVPGSGGPSRTFQHSDLLIKITDLGQEQGHSSPWGQSGPFPGGGRDERKQKNVF